MAKARPPIVLSLSRALLDEASQKKVDIFLKDFKSRARNLNTLLELYTVELAVLERLYYKGNNQHNASLFWKRVSEMRRYGKRFQDMEIGVTVQTLRGLFYGEETALS